MAKSAAVKNPSTLKPVSRWETSKTMQTVITKEIKPNVKILIGKVRIRSKKPMVAFTTANKTPVNTAVK